jgi:hypothetical protein
LVGEFRKNDISYHGHPPWLGPRATWHEEVVLRLPQQLHCSIIYIIVVPDMHGQKVGTENFQIVTSFRASRRDNLPERPSRLRNRGEGKLTARVVHDRTPFISGV